MFKHYFTTAWKNLLRGERYSAITVAGLALGLAVALTTAAYVRHELGYDRWIPQARRIGVVETTFALSPENTFTVPAAPAPAKAQFSAEIPSIVAATRFSRSNRKLMKDGTALALKVFAADADYFEVFDLPFVAGQPGTALSQPHAIVLTRATARRLFGSQSALGRLVKVQDQDPHVVTAVIEDFPSATSFPFDALLPFTLSKDTDPASYNWGMVSRSLFVKLSPVADFGQVESLMGKVARPHVAEVFSALPDGGSALRFHLRHLTDTHLHGAGGPFGGLISNDLTSLLAIGLIGLLILVMAAFNTMNLALTRSMERASEVALRKTVGATRGQIMVQLTGESMLVTLLALALGLLLAGALQPYFAALIGLDQPLNVVADPAQVGIAVGLSLLAVLIGGLYPILVASGYRPGRLVNRDAAQRRSGHLAHTLMVFQFAVAIALASSTLVIQRQVAFAGSGALGFFAENVLVVGGFPGLEALQANSEGAARVASLEAACRRLSLVTNTSLAFMAPGGLAMRTTIVTPISGGDPISVEQYPVGVGFFAVLGIGPLYGRVFDPRRLTDAMHGAKDARHGAVVLNEIATRRLGFATPAKAIGKVLDGKYEVIGVIGNIPMHSLHDTVRATIFTAGDQEVLASSSEVQLMIRVLPGARAQAQAAIEQQVKALFPATRAPITVRPLSLQVAAQYQHDRQQSEALASASAIAMLIAVLGLYGLSALAAQRRTREIGIRKVHGASLPNILQLVLWQSTKPVLIAVLIAWLVADRAMRHWLEGFALRIPLDPWLFLATGAGALLVALITVSGHARAIAHTHPALALREE